MTNSDLRTHIEMIQKSLQQIQSHLREDISHVNDPKLQAMFVTSAEVIGGLIKAFQDYETINEAAWKAMPASASGA